MTLRTTHIATGAFLSCMLVAPTTGAPEATEALPSLDTDMAFRLDPARGGDEYLLGMLQDEEPAAPAGGGDNTGTDPRDFSNKFMPYFRYTELENDVEVKELTLFGLYAFDPRFAMTYELPVAKNLDYSDLDAFKMGSGGVPPGSGFPGGVPGNGIPFDDLDSDGDNTGVGDLILRFFVRPESLEWDINDEGDSFSIMPTLEFTLPTATDDVLGSESLIVSPALTFVADIPGPAPFGLGFIAAMNFIDFDVYKDNSRNSTTRYRGRIFWMQPLTKPGSNLFDGLYILTEVQPIYDFMTSDFDLWIGPEFGKVVNEDFVVYAKPGFGIDTDPEDRDFTFEVGVRIFY